MIVKKIKNTTTETLVLHGVKLDPEQIREVDAHLGENLANCPNFEAYVTSGDVVLFLGDTELSVADSIIFSKMTQDADSLYFDDSITNFNLTEPSIQKAIENITTAGGGSWIANTLNSEGITPTDNKEIAVGTPTAGREAVFGGGDSYASLDSVKVYSYNGSSFTDRTSQIISTEGDSLSFDGTASDNMIYIASLLDDGSDKLMFPGMKLLITTASDLGSGDIVFEIWDGSIWVEFNHQSTGSGDRYLPHGNELFEQTGSFQYLFDTRILKDWSKNDPMSLGTDYYWMRLRIDGNITTSPSIDHIKLHPKGRTEINADGTITFYGVSMPRVPLNVGYGSWQAASDSPGDRDFSLADRLGVGRKENYFEDGITRDRTGFVVKLPYGLCTADPITLCFLFFSNEDRNAGDVKFNIRWDTVTHGDRIYQNTDGPAESPNQQMLTGYYPMPKDLRHYAHTLCVDIEIPHAIAETSDGVPTYLVVSLEREGASDSYGGNIVMADIGAEYSAFMVGGHL